MNYLTFKAIQLTENKFSLYETKIYVLENICFQLDQGQVSFCLFALRENLMTLIKI